MSKQILTDAIKAMIPDFAKDIRLNIDTTLNRSSLEDEIAIAATLVVAFTNQNKALYELVKNHGALTEELLNAAHTAASLMAMNNTYYPFAEMAQDPELKTAGPQLRMNAYAQHGGIAKKHFEMLTLVASIIGKCEFCIHSHYQILKQEGVEMQSLKDLGRLAAVMNAVCKIMHIA
jgi:lipoyl-dependent peroxiredoxin subunit D